jgi:hypothetical protein
LFSSTFFFSSFLAFIFLPLVSSSLAKFAKDVVRKKKLTGYFNFKSFYVGFLNIYLNFSFFIPWTITTWPRWWLSKVFASLLLFFSWFLFAEKLQNEIVEVLRKYHEEDVDRYIITKVYRA